MMPRSVGARRPANADAAADSEPRPAAHRAAAKKAARTPRSATGARGAPAKRSARAASNALNGGRARDREVIDTAITIFWRKGYAATSVQDVADALGMLKGSLYYYIDSKEGLLRKIFDDSQAAVVELIAATAQPDPRGSQAARLSQFLYGYGMWTLSNLERAGLYSREWRYAGPELRKSLSQHQQQLDRHLRTLLAAAQDEAGIEFGGSLHHLSSFIWAAFVGLPDWFRPSGPQRADEVAAQYVTIALQAAGLSAVDPAVLRG